MNTRKSYRVTKSFEASMIGEGRACVTNPEPDNTTMNVGDFVWAYPEKDGFIRFTKGYYATFCTSSIVFFDCTERYIAEEPRSL